MSQHRPPIDNILATVRTFLDACTPKLDGELRYHAQVSAYLLSMCERELRIGAGFDASERQGLATLLGHDAPTAVLNAELAAALRGGQFDDALLQVLAVLLPIAADKVAVVRPDHLDPRDRRQEPP